MNKRGYTLLEVTLFLAISGGLVLVAFIGLGPRLRNIRFTDAVRAYETSSQTQFSNFKNGVNLRASNVGCQVHSYPTPPSSYPSVALNSSGVADQGSSVCVINGMIVRFDESASSAKFYPIVSRRTADASCLANASTSNFEKLFCYGPMAANYIGSTTLSQSVPYKNGAARVGSMSGYTVYGQLQDPGGTTVYPFVSQNWNDQGNVLLPVLSNGTRVTTRSGTADSACLLLGLGGRQASIVYKANNFAPEALFDRSCP